MDNTNDKACYCDPNQAAAVTINQFSRLGRTQPAHMVFAIHMVDGGRGAEHCPELSDNNRAKLSAYLNRFNLEE